MNSLNNSKTNSIFTVRALICLSFLFLFSISTAASVTWSIPPVAPSVNVNSTEFWITSLGSLGDANTTQFIDGALTLSINTSWLDSFGDGEWLQLDGGNSPSANINWGGFDLDNVGTLTSPTVANHPHPSMKTTASPSFVNLAIGSNDGDKLSIIGSVATFEAKFVDEDIVFLAVDDAESIILSGWQSFNLGGAILAGIVDFTMTGKLSINNMFYVESTGDTYWAGAGSGLVFSQIYTQGGSSTLVLPAQDTWYQITAFTVNGDSNMATPDHTNDHITIPIRGRYLTQSSLAISSATTNEYVFEIQVSNGGFGIVNTDGRRTTTNADEVYTTNGMSSIVEFWGAETVELWIKRIDGGAVSSTIKIVDASITLNQVGG